MSREIRERLKPAQKWIETAVTNVFATAVEERKMRYVVKLIVTGDGQSTRVLDLYKVEEDGSLTPFILNVNVAAPEKKEIPEIMDLESPILVLEGGTNLAGKVSGNSVSLTAIYWDDTV